MSYLQSSGSKCRVKSSTWYKYQWYCESSRQSKRSWAVYSEQRLYLCWWYGRCSQRLASNCNQWPCGRLLPSYQNLVENRNKSRNYSGSTYRIEALTWTHPRMNTLLSNSTSCLWRRKQWPEWINRSRSKSVRFYPSAFTRVPTKSRALASHFHPATQPSPQSQSASYLIT